MKHITLQSTCEHNGVDEAELGVSLNRVLFRFGHLKLEYLGGRSWI